MNISRISRQYIFPMIFVTVPFGYSVYSPDLPSAITQGKTIEEAIFMAKDVLCNILIIYEDEGMEIPSPVLPAITPSETDAFVTLIEVNTVDHRKIHDDRTIKKTLTLPSWLNTMAEREGINFSQTLQHALKQRLGV